MTDLLRRCVEEVLDEAAIKAEEHFIGLDENDNPKYSRGISWIIREFKSSVVTEKILEKFIRQRKFLRRRFK